MLLSCNKVLFGWLVLRRDPIIHRERFPLFIVCLRHGVMGCRGNGYESSGDGLRLIAAGKHSRSRPARPRQEKYCGCRFPAVEPKKKWK
jgi:hypothetical protein